MAEERDTAEEIARRGREIYDRDIRPEVEPAHTGEFLVVDVTTGDYELDADEARAFDRAEEKNSDGLFYLMRVGYRAAHRIGTSPRSTLSKSPRRLLQRLIEATEGLRG